MTANRGWWGLHDPDASRPRSATERGDGDRASNGHRDDPGAPDRIADHLLETTRELVRTSSRDAAERAVCEQLVESERYQFAWVGERELDGDRIAPRVAAGENRGRLDGPVTADGTAVRNAAERAMCTGELQVVDAPSPGSRPEGAAGRRVESVAAVPLRYGETVYSALVVHAVRAGAFGERERTGLDTLGRTVGTVIHDARSRDLLFADAVVELTFRLGDDARLARIAATLDCELALEGYVASGDRWIQYLAVSGASPEAVIEAAVADPPVGRARVVGDGDDGGRVELLVTESSLLHAVTAAGASVRTAEADAGGGRLTVEAPADADVRELVTHVRGACPGSELRTRREHDRAVTTGDAPGGLFEDLTDRQQDALEVAYRAGYFDWPRESTAEEIADSLDLAPPTLHGHLRKAERAIVSRLLDDDLSP